MKKKIDVNLLYILFICSLVYCVPFNLFAEAKITHVHFKEIDSTQLYTKKHAEGLVSNPGELAVVTADLQTNGLGHQGRKWHSSSEGGLYVTYLTLFPKDNDEGLFHVILVSALAINKTLQDLGIECNIKWINDVLVYGKKVSGSLCEIIPSQLEDYYYLLIGIGINVNQDFDEIALIDQPATSIFIETEKKVCKRTILASLTDNIKEYLSNLLKNGFSKGYEEVQSLLLYKDRYIEFESDPNFYVIGQMKGINEKGELLLDIKGQGIKAFDHGRIRRVI